MKENKIIVHKNILNINNLIREFPTKILEIIEFKNFIIIRIGYNSQISDNIFRTLATEYMELRLVNSSLVKYSLPKLNGFEPSQQDVNVLNGELVH